MKILIIGFLAFIIWSSVAAYLYVCKIKGLCNEMVIMQMSESTPGNAIAPDTLQKPSDQVEAPAPKNLYTYFAFDKSEFTPDDAMTRYFVESTAYLDKNKEASLIITGHTDAIGSDEYNQALGFRRAQSVARYFENKGMPENKIKLVSRGEKEPADDNSTAAGRAKNRRTVITIIK